MSRASAWAGGDASGLSGPLSAMTSYVADRTELEQLSSDELHDRAMKVARRHADVRFFWRILQALPAAEAATGDMDEAKNDVQSLYGRINDLRQLDRPEIEEALRPMYVD